MLLPVVTLLLDSHVFPSTASVILRPIMTLSSHHASLQSPLDTLELMKRAFALH